MKPKQLHPHHHHHHHDIFNFIFSLSSLKCIHATMILISINPNNRLSSSLSHRDLFNPIENNHISPCVPRFDLLVCHKIGVSRFSFLSLCFVFINFNDLVCDGCRLTKQQQKKGNFGTFENFPKFWEKLEILSVIRAI